MYVQDEPLIFPAIPLIVAYNLIAINILLYINS